MAAALVQSAHHIASTLLSTSQIQPGAVVPAQSVKENEPSALEPLVLKGKNIIVGVVGAFTGTCHGQIPGYIDAFDQFRARGVSNIYVVAVNDVFVMKAWKDSLAPTGTPIHFIADDKGHLVSSLGLIFDASANLGSPRSKRFVLVTDGDTVASLAVEENPGKVTITDAQAVLAQI